MFVTDLLVAAGPVAGLALAWILFQTHAYVRDRREVARWSPE
jgi:hypothetical protein